MGSEDEGENKDRRSFSVFNTLWPVTGHIATAKPFLTQIVTEEQWRNTYKLMSSTELKQLTKIDKF